MQKPSFLLLIVAALCLTAGVYAGYIYGKSKGSAAGYVIGYENGKTDLIDEQKKVEEEALKKVQNSANPFSGVEEKVNPFKDVYKNPFE